MPSLQAYDAKLDYSYAPGVFPAMECLLNRPETVRRLLVHSQSQESEGVQKLAALCDARHIRVEVADKALARISGKENCFAAAVFEKRQGVLSPDGSQVVLHNPADFGNMGTILRTCLGFGVNSLAIIRPAADVFDPRVVRASMGALFSLSVKVYDRFEDYRGEFPRHTLYPFMLDGSTPLAQAAAQPRMPFALVFGNEGRGLPPAFSQLGQAVRIPHSGRIDSLNLSIAAAIGIYAFTNAMKER